MNELKNEYKVDNSHLEEMMAQPITDQMQREVLEELKGSRMFLPVEFGQDAFESIENSKPGDVIEGPDGFKILYLKDDDGNKIVPLFTSGEMMEEAGTLTSVMVIYMQDLANLLMQTDEYSIIAINPFTQNNLNMPIDAFLSLFEKDTD